MSRFFATGGTDSESSSESSDEEQKPVPAKTALKRQVFSDDEEEEKRVVRSQKDKRYDELKDLIRVVRNGEKIKDVAKVQTGFESLQKAFQKAKVVVEKEGGTPRFYVRALMELEDFVKDLWEDKEAKQKLSKVNAKALGTLRQKMRKYDKEFEAEIESYRMNPVESEEEKEGEESGSDAESEEEEGKEEKVTPAPPARELPKAEEKDEDDSDDSMKWEMSSSESSDSEVEAERGGTFYTADYFLKKDKTNLKEDFKARKPREQKKQVKIEEEEEEGEEREGEEWQTVQRTAKDQLSKQEMKKLLFGREVDIDHDVIAKKRNEIVAGKGKRTVDHGTQLDQLKMLIQLSNEANLGVGIHLRLVTDLIGTIFDIPSVAAAMKDDVWKSCVDHLETLMEMLEANPDIELSMRVSDEEENFTSPDKPYKLYGSVVVFIERLDEEFTKTLQACDAHSTEYVSKLQGETTVAVLIERVQHYLEQRYGDSWPTLLCRIYIRRIEHLYYKIDRNTVSSDVSSTSPTDTREEDASTVMAKLTKFIYNYPGLDLGRVRTRAMLCHIYHHALHDRWFQARDLMLMSHLQEAIHLADVSTQLLYNRALVQLGMCAFRHGMIKDAHDALVDIQSSGRSKELLCQGLIARHDRSVEQEKLERRRQIPFHMHINLELMECVYLTSAMLMEIPYMAAAETEGRRRIISKSFHHQLKYHEKQPLVGPPESMREHVVAAAHAMKKGDWKACKDFILGIKAWDLVINVEKVKEMLTRKIQEETLRTYIFTYSEIYDSLSLERLSEMFELPLKTIHCIVSKMIIKEELLASLDEPTQTIVMHHAKPNRLQSQAVLLSEKIAVLAEHNEELMKLKHAGPWNVGQGHHHPYHGRGHMQPWQGKHRRPPAHAR